MGVRVTIQKRVTNLLQTGTFHTVVYDTSHQPVEGEGTVTPSSVSVSEVSGGLSDSSRLGATSSGFVLADWRFEAVAEFTQEVDTSFFMLNELQKLNFSEDNLLVTIVPAGDFQVTHPPRNASHNGTKLTIGLTVNTRR